MMGLWVRLIRLCVLAAATATKKQSLRWWWWCWWWRWWWWWWCVMCDVRCSRKAWKSCENLHHFEKRTNPKQSTMCLPKRLLVLDVVCRFLLFILMIFVFFEQLRRCRRHHHHHHHHAYYNDCEWYRLSLNVFVRFFVMFCRSFVVIYRLPFCSFCVIHSTDIQELSLCRYGIYRYIDTYTCIYMYIAFVVYSPFAVANADVVLIPNTHIPLHSTRIMACNYVSKMCLLAFSISCFDIHVPVSFFC